jgi:hypothetical protein
MLNEIPRTSGDVRRILLDAMAAVKNRDMTCADAQAIASLSKEITSSMQVEINVAKATIMLKEEGMAFQATRRMGKMIIDDDSNMALDGTSSK